MAAAANTVSIAIDGTSVIELTKEGSQQSLKKGGTGSLEGTSVLHSNYQSAQNPSSFFQPNLEQSQSVKNLRLGAPGLTDSASSSSLLMAAAKRQQAHGLHGSRANNQTAKPLTS